MLGFTELIHGLKKLGSETAYTLVPVLQFSGLGLGGGRAFTRHKSGGLTPHSQGA